MTNVLLADDHLMFSEGLISLFTKDKEIQFVGHAEDGNATLSMVKALSPDVVLMDINMPGKDGIECTKHIKKHHPKVKVIVLSTYGSREFVESMVSLGVDGYLLKNTSKEELKMAILTVSSGKVFFTKQLQEEYHEATLKQEAENHKTINLSKREMEVVGQLAKGLNVSEIADTLNLSAYTIETHKKNVQTKLGVKNAAGIIRYAVERGLVSE